MVLILKLDIIYSKGLGPTPYDGMLEKESVYVSGQILGSPVINTEKLSL